MSRCSIVIPVHGRAGLTARCLDALLATPDPDRLEIIVVDDGSPDHTTEVLDGYGPAISVVRLERNTGFATACNRGAAVAGGELLVFLNNDVLPRPGWLSALVNRLDGHPQAAAVGAKLLYPDGTIQHAGVVFGQDRQPRHIYAGFPGDHPAVNRSRPYQAVTAACMLVRRPVFEDVGGFHTGYRNGLEDVDLCLRLGQAGHEVHYSHHSVLEHLESVTRGRSSPDIDAGIRRFQDRWGDDVRPDDIEYYVRDGLLTLAYDELYPVRVGLSPLLAVLDMEARRDSVERQLLRRGRQVAALLHDVVHLTAQVVDRPVDSPHHRAGSTRSPAAEAGDLSDAELDARIRDIEARVRSLHRDLDAGTRGKGFTPAPGLAYRGLVDRTRDLVEETVPAGATVLVITRGDDRLLELTDRRGWHYPRAEDGAYAGHYPANGHAAVTHLEDLRQRGATFLVIPEPSAWWLGEYPELAQRLRGARVAVRRGVAAIYELGSADPADTRNRGGNLVESR